MVGEGWGGGKVLAVRKVGQQLPFKGYAGFRKNFSAAFKNWQGFSHSKSGNLVTDLCYSILEYMIALKPTVNPR